MVTHNLYKKHAMLFVKNKKQKIIITRENDCYYITDLYTMLKLSAVYYDVLIRPLSTVFIQLENGQKAIRNPGEELPEIDLTAPNLADIFNLYKCENPVNITDFVYHPIGNKYAAIRMVEINRNFYQYNGKFIDAALEYAEEFMASGDRFPVLKYEDDMGVGCLIMPINNAKCNESIANIKEAMRNEHKRNHADR